MECLEKPVWNNYTEEELWQIQIPELDKAAEKKVKKNWDSIAKPLDGMGRFETLTARIGAITGTDELDIRKKAVLILCADNGIVEEGISQSGKEVTLAVAKSMAQKQSSVCKMAQALGAVTIPVDIGIDSREVTDGVRNKKIRCGTRNFRKEPAMTQEEVVKAIAVGMELAAECKDAGYQMIATGEMGTGNTTTSSAVVAALLGCEADLVTGRGAGLNDEGLRKKREVIQESIEKYDLRHKSAFEILRTVGGLDIAGLAGVCIGGAVCRIPVVLDGFISMAAALTAERLFPGVKEYLIPSHKGREPAVVLLMKALEMNPVIDADMALGEGTGAVMMFALLDMAMSVYREKTGFSDIEVEQYERYKQDDDFD